MIYEFIATLTAGFGMAGIAMVVRHLSKLGGKITPKWLVPLFATIGMLGFQIHQEYHWHEQQINQSATPLKVVKKVTDSTWYRPWSFIKPQVVRFMAISEPKPIQPTQDNINSDHTIKQFNLYLFERRISTKVVPQLMDCDLPAYADPIHQANVAEASGQTDKSPLKIADLHWQTLDQDDALVQAVCHHNS